MARLSWPAIFALSAAVASAQPSDDARAILQDVAAAARATKSWRGEGVEIGEISAVDLHIRDTVHFRVAADGPLKLRSESTADSTRAERDLFVCDGTHQWIYHSPDRSFYKNAIASSCGDARFSEWSKTSDNLLTASVIGRDQLEFNGRLRECKIVRAEYKSPEVVNNETTVRRTVRTMCIDTENNLILQDSSEKTVPDSGAHVSTTITYNKYERDPTFSSDYFQAPVPTGTFQDPGPYLDREDSAAEKGVYRMGGNVSGPELIYNAEPSYTAEARRTGISGVVLLSLIVDADGKPRDVGVVQGLDRGLDEKALEVVQTWRFRAGMRNGVPVAVGGIVVAVSFRLP